MNDCNQCPVHSVRPQQCRTYPDWPQIWASNESFQEELRSCKGLQKAVQSLGVDISFLDIEAT